MSCTTANPALGKGWLMSLNLGYIVDDSESGNDDESWDSEEDWWWKLSCNHVGLLLNDLIYNLINKRTLLCKRFTIDSKNILKLVEQK